MPRKASGELVIRARYVRGGSASQRRALIGRHTISSPARTQGTAAFGFDGNAVSVVVPCRRLMNRLDIVRWIIAIPARRMQKDQHQAGHTIPPSHSGRRASSRRPCCRKESAVASRLSNLAGQESTDWHWRQLCGSEFSLSAPPIEALLNQPACRQSCDRAFGAWCLGSSQSRPTLQPSWPWPRQER